MSSSRDRFENAMDRLVYRAVDGVKQAAPGLSSPGKVSFGRIRPGRTTAAFLKARKLAAIFGNSLLRNDILYVCSGNVPAWYVLREKARGVRIVANQNGVHYPGWYGPGWEEANEVRLLPHYRAAEHVVFQSAFCEEASRRFLGDPRGSSEVLHNPVDTHRFVPDPERPFDPESPVLLSTGNFHSLAKEGRLRLVLDAFSLVRRSLPGATLVVAGHFAPGLRERLAPALAEGARLEGPFDPDDAPAVYRRGDVYLNSQYNDACPSAVLEAMSCGLPVVHLDCGGTPELAGDAGVAVAVERSWDAQPLPRPEAYAAAVLDAVARRGSLSAAARRRCEERFDIGPWAARHREIFAALRRGERP